MGFLALPSLWPTLHWLATGESWPPASDAAATRFVERVTQESLLPLLGGNADLPPLVRAAVSNHSAMLRANLARTEMIAQALATISKMMGREPLIVLKGCDFAFRLYDRPELRPMGDVDVLVREGEMDRIAGLLTERGLQREYPAGPASRSRSHHEATFRVRAVTVEVHHRFVQKPRYRIDYNRVWNRAAPLTAAGAEVLRLSNVDAFVYQTISIGLKYFVSPLIRFVDLWQIRHTEPDLIARAAVLAHEWQARHVFYAVLRYAGTLFPEFRDHETESTLAAMLGRPRRELLDRFVLPPHRGGRPGTPSRARQLWQKFWLMDSMSRRVAFVASHTAASIAGRFRG